MGLKNLFTVPQGKKITEKQFLRVLISSVASILLCMTCLASTTWAWFALEISSKDNTIQVGSFEVAVVVSGGGVTVEPQDNGTYHLDAGTYTVTITSGASSTVSGYCVLNLNGTAYETGSIEPGGTGEILVTVHTVSQADADGTEQSVAVLTVTPMWGTPTAAVSEISEESTEPETTAPTETTAPEETTVPAETTEPEEPETSAPTDPTTETTETTVPSETTETTTATEPDTTQPSTEPASTESSESTETTETTEASEPTQDTTPTGTESSEPTETASEPTENAETSEPASEPTEPDPSTDS